MTYELAKELKDAGFPQERRGGVLWMNAEKIPAELIAPGQALNVAQANFAYAPTLPELIEACGEKFHCLVHTTMGGIDSDREYWSAGPDRDSINWLSGKTPEEAVACFWLALNTKTP